MAERHSFSMPKIVIIGAGIQGVSVALALAARGVDSTILESQPEPLRGASYGNEGKIHLGLVYALDHSGDTGLEMLKGAHSFAPLLDRWCGQLPWQAWRSAGFRYAVMPGSLADLPMLEAYYEQLRLRIPEAIDNLPVTPSYFGESLSWLSKRAGDDRGSPRVNGRGVPCVDTQEIAIDVGLFTAKLKDVVRENPRITLCSNSRVNSAERSGTGFRLGVESADETRQIDADVVINCAWTDRIRLDRQVSECNKDARLTYRIKHRVIVRPRSSVNDLMPVTMVQGPYGDVTPYRDGSIYLSWYPECRTYIDHMPPPVDVCGPEILGAIAARTLKQMADMFPDLIDAQILSCSPGIIVAEGCGRDVDDPDSELHRRSTSGPRGGDGWWSVDTGKLTLGPLHGERTAQLVLEELGIGTARARTRMKASA